MREDIEFDYKKIGIPGRKWLSCFDLLGFTRLVENEGLDEVLYIYWNCINSLYRKEFAVEGTDFAWFSDTFLVFTNNDSRMAWVFHELISTVFFRDLILSEIPVRGAMTCGSLYADRSTGVFVGRALVEAHQYCEGQDWIGFVICPSGVARIHEYGHVFRNWVEWDVPFKDGNVKSLPCSIIGANPDHLGKSVTIPVLERMISEQKEPRIVAKYKRTIEFLKRHSGRGKAAPLSFDVEKTS